ncbi:subtilisin-like protease SBT1.4 [Papaver somniferum]|uniref:subtilisin-like protease SBT1.4 n=1 Tax=Papaver somniferum TaxID=3469 RepID=UPI000E6F7DC1|nr:subtilisin-like protease SBT1.4 [Papaver somniferum]
MKTSSLWGVFVFLAFSALIIPSYSQDQPSDHDHDEQLKTFIVFVSKSDKPSVFSSHLHWYSATLQSLPPSPISSSSSDHHDGSPSREVMYSYDHVAHGFAARLTPSQASHLENLPGILSVIPDSFVEPHTTHSPQFLGLNYGYGLWPNSSYGEDVIIGVFDGGIWPEHQSFNDFGLTPVPKRWKGTCQTGPDFPPCNRKLIGAQAFYKGIEAHLGHRFDADGSKDSRSPRDTSGHGTHCAATAAGSPVMNAGFHNDSVGEAKGVATKARIAAYKVMWKGGAVTSDSLAGYEQVVKDGVDVMSISLGHGYGTPYHRSPIAIGTFGATEKGIVVSLAAGNNGAKGPKTVGNSAPWMLTVGGSTIDRESRADVILGDGQVIPGSLSPTQVAGKIVVCNADLKNPAVKKASVAKAARGVGMIHVQTIDQFEALGARNYPIPATAVTKSSGLKIITYITSNRKDDKKPTPKIDFRGTVTGSSFLSPAPKVATFSSTGPNPLIPEILKPDVIAPGVNILAARSGSDAEFVMKSGTSMACPHVRGLAALLRNAFPKWSPAAIKLALMTTAYIVDNSGKYITVINNTGGDNGKFSTPFQHGSGHVDPNKALNPGLVYDITPSDYEAFLCTIGYNKKQMKLFVKDRNVDCDSVGLSTVGDLNYPLFSVVFESAGRSQTGSIREWLRMLEFQQMQFTN